ncbi:MAG: response regulator transcription factor [Clostridia bacterium]|nr:response regulator transcription factor [Clostridia bacterium]
MRLLLAEDERSLSRAVKAILEKNNYAVDAVFDGQEAVDYLAVGSYDGVILDVMMPKLDGFSVLREIRKRGDSTPVLMLTARSEVDDKVNGLDLGANDYLTKPFHTRELLARIRAMTRAQTPQNLDNTMRVGNISLDRSTFELTGPGGDCRLAHKEYQMMEILMSSPKTIIPTETFMTKVWGYDTESDVSVIWVYISYLRKKLTAIGANVQIKAVRNAGYTLEVSE